jgi:hypothetical protein
MGGTGIIVGIRAASADTNGANGTASSSKDKQRVKYRIAMVTRATGESRGEDDKSRGKSRGKSLQHLFSGDTAGTLDSEKDATEEEEALMLALPINTMKQRLESVGLTSDGCDTKLALVRRLMKAQASTTWDGAMNIELSQIVVADLLTRSKARDMGPAGNGSGDVIRIAARYCSRNTVARTSASMCQAATAHTAC